MDPELTVATVGAAFLGGQLISPAVDAVKPYIGSKACPLAAILFGALFGLLAGVTAAVDEGNAALLIPTLMVGLAGGLLASRNYKSASEDGAVKARAETSDVVAQAVAVLASDAEAPIYPMGATPGPPPAPHRDPTLYVSRPDAGSGGPPDLDKPVRKRPPRG